MRRRTRRSGRRSRARTRATTTSTPFPDRCTPLFFPPYDLSRDLLIPHPLHCILAILLLPSRTVELPTSEEAVSFLLLSRALLALLFAFLRLVSLRPQALHKHARRIPPPAAPGPPTCPRFPPSSPPSPLPAEEADEVVEGGDTSAEQGVGRRGEIVRGCEGGEEGGEVGGGEDIGRRKDTRGVTSQGRGE